MPTNLPPAAPHDPAVTPAASPDTLPAASEADGSAEPGYLVPLAVAVDPDEVLGRGEWRPELRLRLDEKGAAHL